MEIKLLLCTEKKYLPEYRWSDFSNFWSWVESWHLDIHTTLVT